MGEPDVAADDAPLPDDGLAAMHRGPSVNRHAIFKRRMTLPLIFASRDGERAERDALVELHIIAEDGRLADDDARAVIDEEALADHGARVDIDPRLSVRGLAHDARDERHAEAQELMRDTIGRDGLNAWIAEHHLFDAARRRITCISRKGIAVRKLAEARDAA